MNKPTFIYSISSSLIGALWYLGPSCQSSNTVAIFTAGVTFAAIFSGTMLAATAAPEQNQ